MENDGGGEEDGGTSRRMEEVDGRTKVCDVL